MKNKRIISFVLLFVTHHLISANPVQGKTGCWTIPLCFETASIILEDSAYKNGVVYKDSIPFDQFILINCKNGKTRTIDSCEPFSFNCSYYMDEITADLFAHGHFAGIQNDTLALWIQFATTDYSKDDIYFKNESFESMDSVQLLKMPINDMEYFSFTKYNESAIFGAFATTYIVGLTNLFIGAPFESIDYKKNTFNFKTYKKMLLISSGAIVFGGLSAAISKRRAQNLIFIPEEGYGRNCWTLSPIKQDH